MSEHMSTFKNYPGQDVLISYLKERGIKSSYYGFLSANHDIIVNSILSTDKCEKLNSIWLHHFLTEAKSQLDWKIFVEVKNKAIADNSRYTKYLQTFWQNVFKEYEKENLVPNELSKGQSDWNMKTTTLQVKQKEELKRTRDDADIENLSTEYWKKQSRILKQSKDKLVYRQVVDNAFLVASAYESLIEDNIIPFIKLLKITLLTRSQMSLSSANEPVLQAIVENLLPSNYCIPELSLVMNGKKPKGSGRFSYSDIFILSDTGNNYVILELKYISLVGLNINQKNNLGSNELENLDKVLEKENEESLLKRQYSYWSKENKKTNITTIGEILNNGIDQLNSYMKVISKGKATNYSSSGIFDRRIKVSKSNPNKLKGFVVLVIGFRRILWKSVDDVTTNYTYNKV
ncbi:hypothetical protein C1646_774151 [Rhizophagus diaphanus]|nr:hypothetical protein C1646_774151 [Rhizophagus diaphanus] [Rhizophagus sp. MUCL 43196]